MKQNWFLYDGSLMRKVEKEIERGALEQRKKAASHIKKIILEKAKARKVTGNLAKGVYMKNTRNSSFVGIRAPGFQNYLLEFGHFAGKATTTEGRKWIAPTPIVYPTFAAQAKEVERIMSEPWIG